MPSIFQSRLDDQSIEEIMQSLSLEEQLKTSMNFLEPRSKLDIETIVKLIETLLSDKMLYQNKQLKRKILQTKNGWIQINHILSFKQIRDVFKEVQLFNMVGEDRIINLMRVYLKHYESPLVMNKKSIKRKIPFVDKTKLVKPIYVENYPEEKKMQAACQVLNCITEIYKVKFRVGQQWGYVYAAEPQKIIDFCCSIQNQDEFFFNQRQNQQWKLNAQPYQSLADITSSLRCIQSQFQQYFSQKLINSFLLGVVQQITGHLAQSRELKRWIDNEMIKRQGLTRHTLQIPNRQLCEGFLHKSSCFLNRHDIQIVSNPNTDIGFDQDRMSKKERQNRKEELMQKIHKINQIFNDFLHFYLPHEKFNQQKLKTENHPKRNPNLISQNVMLTEKVEQQIDTILNQRFHKPTNPTKPHKSTTINYGESDVVEI